MILYLAAWRLEFTQFIMALEGNYIRPDTKPWLFYILSVFPRVNIVCSSRAVIVHHDVRFEVEPAMARIRSPTRTGFSNQRPHCLFDLR